MIQLDDRGLLRDACYVGGEWRREGGREGMAEFLVPKLVAIGGV